MDLFETSKVTWLPKERLTKISEANAGTPNVAASMFLWKTTNSLEAPIRKHHSSKHLCTLFVDFDCPFGGPPKTFVFTQPNLIRVVGNCNRDFEKRSLISPLFDVGYVDLAGKPMDIAILGVLVN